MELKPVGKMGLIKRKQFLQKRDFSRSHEVGATGGASVKCRSGVLFEVLHLPFFRRRSSH